MMTLVVLTALILTLGCANHIRWADAVIWDRVEGTDKVSLDEQRIENGLIQAKVRFICQKRQFAVTNEYFTPYDSSHETYEVPVGLVTLPFTALYYLGCYAISLATAPIEASAGPFHWSAAGLNPFLNVENGMFAERYSIKEKPGSRRPQEGSTPEPYDAVLPPEDGAVKAWFDGGGVITLSVGDELLLTVNLIEVARVMPAADAQKLMIEMALKWNQDAEPVVKQVAVFIDKDLAAKLYELRDYSHVVMTTTDRITFDIAADKIDETGFSREMAMIRDKRKGQLVETRVAPEAEK